MPKIIFTSRYLRDAPPAQLENYMDYIANRPRVERVREHGLFTDAGKSVVFSRVQQEVTDHKGAAWTYVVSLRREDAGRLAGSESGSLRQLEGIEKKQKRPAACPDKTKR